MKNQVIRLSMIVAVSAVLLFVVDSEAEARTYDKSLEYTFSGYGVFIFGQDQADKINLQISPIRDTKDLLVDFDGNVGGESFDFKCTAPKQILKVSNTKKASVEFNTADLECIRDIGLGTTVSATLVGTGEVFIDEKSDSISCNPAGEGVEKCKRNHEINTSYISIADISAYGITIAGIENTEVRHTKLKHTEWTTP